MIRICEKKDKDSWIKLNQAFMDYEYQDDNVWLNPRKEDFLAKDFDRIMSETNSETLLFGIFNEEKMIGFMNVAKFYSVWSHGNVFILDDFFIEKAYRGKGIGAEALKEFEIYARARGIKRIQLMAEHSNPKAVAFYEKKGYDKQVFSFFIKYLI